MEKSFFSFVIPAHNEEKYIENTLEHLRDLDYPADKFEVIIVENGSSDRTLEIAKRFETNGFRVLLSGKGVSRARNVGIDHLYLQSDWVVFLDADTVIGKGFLNELNVYLFGKNDLAVGTTRLRPMPERPYADAWFWIHNMGHMLTKTSFAILIARRDLFLSAQAGPQLRFNEKLPSGEDLEFILDARKRGSYFYLWTKQVATSTRRFDKVGWWKLTFMWGLNAVLPKKLQEDIDYGVVR